LIRNTAPKFPISTKNSAFSAQDDVHTSTYGRNFEFHQPPIDIFGWIDEAYNFEAKIFVLNLPQVITGNCRDGHIAPIKLPVADGVLRFSIEGGGRVFLARGKVEIFSGPTVQIDAVLVKDLAGKTPRIETLQFSWFPIWSCLKSVS